MEKTVPQRRGHCRPGMALGKHQGQPGAVGPPEKEPGPARGGGERTVARALAVVLWEEQSEPSSGYWLEALQGPWGLGTPCSCLALALGGWAGGECPDL